MIKYYSDKTRKYYDSVEAANKAEFEMKEEENREKIRKEREEREKKEKKEKFAAERKARANEVEDARKVMVEAQNKYREVLESFIKQFGSYHYTSQSFGDIPVLFSSLIDFF